MRAVRLERTGGPEVLTLGEVALRPPGPGEIVIRHEAIGLNFIDVYQRIGLYPTPLPTTPGREAAGTVEAVGEGVTRFKVGDRAAYAGDSGAYAEANTLRADRAVRLPDGVSTRIAAAAMLKGMTAELLTRIWPLQAGDPVLVQAAAGGVGSILCQWLAHLGVRVIGTVGSPEKAAFARAHGCEETILYTEEDVTARARAFSGGKGVKVAYDSVGKATWEASLASLAPRSLMVCFGNASGPVPGIEPLRLSQGGSLFLTRPTLFDYIATTESLDASAEALFAVIGSGAVTIEIGQEFALAEASAAHAALEARRTTGASLLIP